MQTLYIIALLTIITIAMAAGTILGLSATHNLPPDEQDPLDHQ